MYNKHSRRANSNWGRKNRNDWQSIGCYMLNIIVCIRNLNWLNTRQQTNGTTRQRKHKGKRLRNQERKIWWRDIENVQKKIVQNPSDFCLHISVANHWERRDAGAYVKLPNALRRFWSTFAWENITSNEQIACLHDAKAWKTEKQNTTYIWKYSYTEYYNTSYVECGVNVAKHCEATRPDSVCLFVFMRIWVRCFSVNAVILLFRIPNILISISLFSRSSHFCDARHRHLWNCTCDRIEIK